MQPALRWSLVTAGLCLSLALPAGATTYVLMEDGVLADQAGLIVDGRIEAAARAADDPYGATEYTVAVIRTLKGSASAGTVTLRVLGGLPRDDGPWYQVWGVPRFRLGERVLLFLSPRRDGRFDLSQLALGAFRGVTQEGRRYAVRPELAVYGVAGGRERVRDFDAFAGWLAARAQGEPRPPDYFVPAPAGGPGRLAERFELFEAQGRNFRWFEFDRGAGVGFRAHEAGQPGMSDGGFGAVATALWRWDQDPGSNVDLRYRGTAGGSNFFNRCDHVNLFVFDDPHDEIDGSYDCSHGGVLAVGGACIDGSAKFQGKEYWTISEGDVLTQDGAGCVFGSAGGKVGEFIFGHEIGHTLGLAHSCGPGTGDPSCSDPAHAAAIMISQVPQRATQGARLGADDRAALAVLYPQADDGGDGGGEEEDPEGWLTSSEVPGFRFRVTILPGGAAEPIRGHKESRCLAETLCASGAVPGRVEVEMRVPGPKPNGKLWPTFVKFTTSRVEIEVEQLATGQTRSYVLEGVGPGDDTLDGLFDRDGFDP